MNYDSILIYIIAILFFVVLAYKASLQSVSNLRKDKANLKFFSIPMLLLILGFTVFCGIRYNVGTDYPRYLSAYETERIFSDRFEPMFRLISLILIKLKLGVAVYFGIWAFLQIVFYLYAFRYEKRLYPYLVYFLFTNGLFLSWMNGIRQDLSSCLLLPCLIFILQNRPVHYIIACIVASMFHISAFLLIVLYPLLKSKSLFANNYIPLLLVCFAVVINYVLGSNIQSLDSVVASYSIAMGRDDVDFNEIAESMNEKEGFGLGMLVRLFFYVSIIVSSNNIKKFVNSLFFDKIVYPLFIIGVFFKYAIPVGAVIISRPFRFFSFFTTIALAYYVYYLFNAKKVAYGKIYAITIIVVSLVLFLAPMVNANPNESYILYQTIFNNL